MADSWSEKAAPYFVWKPWAATAGRTRAGHLVEALTQHRRKSR